MSSVAQEKKSLRIVFTGLAWNSELPFRAALARGEAAAVRSLLPAAVLAYIERNRLYSEAPDAT